MVGDARLILGDSLAVLPTLEAGSVDAVCTDPPYGIEFMGREWDRLTRNCMNPQSESDQEWNAAHSEQDTPGTKDGMPRRMRNRPDIGGSLKYAAQMQAWHQQWAEAVLHVLKPGGYLLAFGGTRTYHRLVCAIEDAGFEIRDTLQWLYGSGFPKGKGNLKPAHEPIVLARKPGPRVLPLPGLEECRVNPGEAVPGGGPSYGKCEGVHEGWKRPAHANYQSKPGHKEGRYPPNLLLCHDFRCRRVGTKKVRGITGGTGNHAGQVYGKRTNEGQPVKDYADADGLETVEAWECHDECPIRLLSLQSGERVSGWTNADSAPSVGPVYGNDYRDRTGPHHRDTGTAARFFPQFAWSAADDVPFLYCPKASRRERGEGNSHCTVKPLALVSWLVKLICPPGGLCLDPFAGSGTTGLACLREGRRFLGIEKEEEYHAIALARLDAALAEIQGEAPLFAGQEECHA